MREPDLIPDCDICGDDTHKDRLADFSGMTTMMI
jgi:hypothetical protein